MIQFLRFTYITAKDAGKHPNMIFDIRTKEFLEHLLTKHKNKLPELIEYIDLGGILQKVQLKKYTGTIESYNELVEFLLEENKPYPNDKDYYQYIYFVDKFGEVTPKFTGNVFNAKSQILYQPGSHYLMPIKDDAQENQK